MATSVAKTALIRLTEGLAQTAGVQGLRVFAVHPGVVNTRLLLSYNYRKKSTRRRSVPRSYASDWHLVAMTDFLGASSRSMDDLDALLERAAELTGQEHLLLRIQ